MPCAGACSTAGCSRSRIATRTFPPGTSRPRSTRPCARSARKAGAARDDLRRARRPRHERRYVQRFGLRLLPRLYAYANPMPYQAARDMEVELAIALQEEGEAGWGGAWGEAPR